MFYRLVAFDYTDVEVELATISGDDKLVVVYYAALLVSAERI